MKSKQPSGIKKCKKRTLEEEKRKADAGALDKFIHRQPVEEVVEEPIEEHVEHQENVEVEVEEAEEQEPVKDLVDICDPRRWEKLNYEELKLLVEKGPKRDTSIMYGPYYKSGRRFSAVLYTKTLPNLEKCDREWLVYLKEFDKVFCFCCKVFRKGISKGKLGEEGYSDWHHVTSRVKELEISLDHLTNRNKWFDMRNGSFLGVIEMLEEFDPVIKEHVRQITNDELHVHYFGHTIQNELILLIAQEIKEELIKTIKEAKYYSIILDLFLNVDDTSEKGLFDITFEELKSFGLEIDDMRGQGYDNGANMKRKHRGVQKRFLDINPRAFYTPCGCHSLNLILCDMPNKCVKGKNFFGFIQCIYTIFANSTKRWEILKIM
ncbi:uncharacterized protein LOC111890562 [Lactuca sativa]|uniref:uncharacterized protein LOC111890562 n=1 Tax=Lactuca sativa TaxID=4236 RepID=UPI000CD93292|nr:uncharacterized protein LOC111890562 [Lactuca sativa]